MEAMNVVRSAVLNFNGITMAYAMGFINALLALLLAFGVNLTQQQQAAVVAFVNAALVILAHLGHRLGESQQHLAETPPVTTPAA